MRALLAAAGYVIALKIEGVIWLPLLSMNVAASTFVGQNIGAQKYDRASKGMWAATGLVSAFTLVASIAIVVFSEPIAYFFSDSADVVGFGVEAIKVYIPLYFIFAGYNALAGGITGAGRTMQVLVISLGAFCALRVILVIAVMKLQASFAALMAIFPISWGVALLAILIYIWRADWLGSKDETKG